MNATKCGAEKEESVLRTGSRNGPVVDFLMVPLQFNWIEKIFDARRRLCAAPRRRCRDHVSQPPTLFPFCCFTESQASQWGGFSRRLLTGLAEMVGTLLFVPRASSRTVRTKSGVEPVIKRARVIPVFVLPVLVASIKSTATTNLPNFGIFSRLVRLG